MASWTQWALDASILLALCALFFQNAHWPKVVLVCLLFRWFASDVGKRCLRTLPRDLK